MDMLMKIDRFDFDICLLDSMDVHVPWRKLLYFSCRFTLLLFCYLTRSVPRTCERHPTARGLAAGETGRRGACVSCGHPLDSTS